MKTHRGIIDMTTSKWLWITMPIMVAATIIILNYFAWVERVEWLRNLP